VAVPLAVALGRIVIQQGEDSLLRLFVVGLRLARPSGIFQNGQPILTEALSPFRHPRQTGLQNAEAGPIRGTASGHGVQSVWIPSHPGIHRPYHSNIWD
jgi:hypothetical protein